MSESAYLPILTALPKEQLGASVAGYLAHELLAQHRSPEASTSLRHPDAGYAITVARLPIRSADVNVCAQLASVAIVAVVMPEGAPPRAYVVTRGP